MRCTTCPSTLNSASYTPDPESVASNATSLWPCTVGALASSPLTFARVRRFVLFQRQVGGEEVDGGGVAVGVAWFGCAVVARRSPPQFALT